MKSSLSPDKGLAILKIKLPGIYKTLTGRKTRLDGIALGIGPRGNWDSQWVLDPSILKLDDMYYMWYTGYDGKNLRIGLATSADALNWSKHDDNPLFDLGESGTWEDFHVYNPCVFQDKDELYMWYAGARVKKGDWEAKIGLATSRDGINWDRHPGNPVLSYELPWELHSVFGPCVLSVDGTYHMWYAGGGIPRGIGLATSGDGKTWVKYDANPVLEGVAGTWEYVGMDRPAVIKVGNEFRMYYSGLQLPYAARIGLATSTDGKEWVKSSQNPVLDLSPNSFDDTYVADCWVMIIDGVYYMWYRGHDGRLSRIGLATSPDGITWTKQR